MDYWNKDSLKEIKTALKTTWVIISLFTTLIILIPFIVDRNNILKITPVCISVSKFNVECALCGMTRAFIEISDGNIKKAYFFNNGSIILYLIFLTNSLIFILTSFYCIIINNRISVLNDI